MFHGLKYEDIENSYPVCQLIRRGLMATDAINDYSVDDVLKMIAGKDAQCWGSFQGDKLVGIVITKILVYPKRRLMQFFLVAGDAFDDWFCEGWEILIAFAKSNGCDALRGVGRVGWLRKLRNNGLTRGYATWSIEI